MSNDIILITGLPHTGKSTLAKKLEERLSYDLHSTTLIRRKLGYKRYNEKQDPIVLRKVYERIEDSIENGKGVVIEGALFVVASVRQEVYTIASRHGIDVLLIECYCSEVMSKRGMRARPMKDDLVSDPRRPEVYDKVAAAWQDINGDFSMFPPLSYIRYNYEIKYVEEVRVNSNVKQLVDRIKEIIKS